MAERKRNANMELLRIIAMAMVVVLHFFKHSGYLPESSAAAEGVSLNGLNVIAIIMESFCIVAVNTYILISGYFGTDSRWKPSKLLNFLCRVWFYALLIPIVLSCFGIPVLAKEEGIYGLIKYIFPVGTSHYWFVTCYFQLLLLMPLLNKAIKAMNRKQLSVVLVCLLIPACGIKSICPIKLVTDNYGYDLLWFICLYLTGAWLRSLGEAALCTMKKKALPLYAGSSLITAVMVVLFYNVTGRYSGAGYYFSVPWHYNFLLCLTGAIGLFLVFMNWEIKEGGAAEVIRKVAGYSFGVYLFHEHLDVNDLWYPFLKGMINPLQKDSVPMLFAELLICLVVIYGVGLCIDFVRAVLFNLIGNCMRKTVLCQKISEWDAWFSDK